MFFAPVLAIACFKVLKYLFWLTGGLMLALFLRQWLYDGIVPVPFHLLISAAIFIAGGFLMIIATRAVQNAAGLIDKE